MKAIFESTTVQSKFKQFQQQYPAWHIITILSILLGVGFGLMVNTPIPIII